MEIIFSIIICINELFINIWNWLLTKIKKKIQFGSELFTNVLRCSQALLYNCLFSAKFWMIVDNSSYSTDFALFILNNLW